MRLNPYRCDPEANGTISLKIGDGAGWNATCAANTSTGCNPVA